MNFNQANWHPGHSHAGYFFFAGFLAAAAFFGAAFFAVAIWDHLISVCGVRSTAIRWMRSYCGPAAGEKSNQNAENNGYPAVFLNPGSGFVAPDPFLPCRAPPDCGNDDDTKGSMSSVKRDVTVVNASGMHLRPAAAFVQAANKHKGCDIFVSREGQRVNGKSIMGLVMLAAAKDTVLTIECSGEGATSALDELCTLIENKFGIDS